MHDDKFNMTCNACPSSIITDANHAQHDEMCVVPNGAGGFDGILRIWDVNAGKLLHSFAPEKESTEVAAKK